MFFEGRGCVSSAGFVFQCRKDEDEEKEKDEGRGVAP
jgi:hypothetical protein